IAVGNASPFYPDFANRAIGLFPVACRIDNANVQISNWFSAANQCPHAVSGSMQDFRLAGFEAFAGGTQLGRCLEPVFSGNDQSRFGEPITGKVGFTPEPVWRKCFEKAIQRDLADGFGTAVRELPGRKVEPFTLLRLDSIDTEIKREVRGGT